MKNFLFLIASLFLTGCASAAKALDTPIGENPFTMQTVMVAATQTAIPTTTLTPTMSPSPTLINFGDLPITETAIVLQRQAVELAQTEQGIAKVDADASLTYAPPSETAAASQSQTPEAQAIATAQTKKTEVADEIVKKEKDAKVEEQNIKNEWLPYLYGGGIVLGVAVFLIVSYAVTYVASEKIKTLRAERAMYDPPKPIDTQREEMLMAKLDQRDAYGFGSVDFSKMPIDRKTLLAVAEKLMEGRPYTQAQMTGAGKPLVKNGNYDTFGDWMVVNKIAKRLSDGRYMIEHLEFFEQVLQQ